MFPRRQLDPEAVLELFAAARVASVAHAPGIDRLAEPPFGDGRCGSDVADLMSVVDEDLRGVPRPLTLTAVADSVTASISGCTVGPGAEVVGEFLIGIAELGRNAEALTPDRLAMGCEMAADRVKRRAGPPLVPAWSLLSVVAETALHLADSVAPMEDVVLAMAEAGLDELERAAASSSSMMEAGVVDATSAAILVVLDSLVAVVHGEDPELPTWEFPETCDGCLDPGGEASMGASRYRVSIVLPGGPDVAPVLGAAWSTLGDGIEIGIGPPDANGVAGGVEAIVYTDDIGAVIEAALGVGRPRRIRVVDTHG